MSENAESSTANIDLSFLEEIDIDSIVEYLNETDNILGNKRKACDALKSINQSLPNESKNKKLKLCTNTTEIVHVSKEYKKHLVNDKDASTDTPILKVNVTINSISPDYTSAVNSTVIEKSLENERNSEKEETFKNAQITPDGDIVMLNNENYSNANLEENITVDLQDKCSQNKVLQEISVSDNNNIDNIESSNTEEIAIQNTCLIMQPGNIEGKLENVEENAKLPINKSDTEKDSSTITDSKMVANDSQKKAQKQDKINEKKNDNSQKTNLPPALSVVVRKDDLSLANKLQKRLHQFLNVKFTDITVMHYGKHSTLFQCLQKGRKYAIKVINSELLTQKVGTEKGKMLNKLQYGVPRNVLYFIYLYASFRLEKRWCLLLDFYPTNLKEELELNGPMHIKTAESLARQLITALYALRCQYIIHSDIKPQHILLNYSNSTLKICGFDRAYYINEVTILPNIGTPSYRAPEVILGYSASYSIDIWSSGLVIYEMITDTKLFPGCINNDILYKQMCVLGNMPYDMVADSMYGSKHFLKGKFLKREGCHITESKIIYNFYKNNSYKNKPYKIYNKFWGSSTSTNEQFKEDLHKISILIYLIQKMIVLHPDDRIPIEVLYDDPFMSQTFY